MVLILGWTEVFTTVPINFTFADEPKIVLSVTVTVAVPVPLIVLVIFTKSPWAPVPPPAVSIDSE